MSAALRLGILASDKIGGGSVSSAWSSLLVVISFAAGMVVGNVAHAIGLLV